MGDLPVVDGASILVRLTAKGSHHIAFILGTDQGQLTTAEIKKLTILFSALRFSMIFT